MLNINNYSCTGRLTRDPETKYSSNGKAICKFGIAIADPKQVNGEWKDSPIFLEVDTFDKTAERCADFIKGQPVYVEGKLRMDQWEKDGVKHSKVKLAGMSVKAVEKAQRADSGDSMDNPWPRASDGLNFNNSEGADDDILF